MSLFVCNAQLVASKLPVKLALCDKAFRAYFTRGNLKATISQEEKAFEFECSHIFVEDGKTLGKTLFEE